MNPRLITQQDLKTHHPKGFLPYITEEYARFANRLYRKLAEPGFDILDANDIREIAITLTLYYEDVLADAGIFRAFTDKMKEMYGRYLPFYDVDEDNYYRDEPNLWDVVFLIWNYLIQKFDDRVINPETSGVISMATDAYELMDEWFEKMPINEEMKKFFTAAHFTESFYPLRDVEYWLLFDCYLTRDMNAFDIIQEQMEEEYGQIPEISMEQMIHGLTCYLITNRKTGPLALYTHEWLAAILRANGKDNEAAVVEQIKCRPVQTYQLECKDDGYLLRDHKGQEIYLTNYNIGIKGKKDTSPYVMGEFVCYKDVWYNNGLTSWLKEDVSLSEAEMTDLNMGEQDENQIIERLVKKNGGSRLFYFKDFDALNEFNKKELGKEIRPGERLSISHDQLHSTWTVFVPEKGSQFYNSVDMAPCIRDPRNPFYNEKRAQEEAFGMALNLPVEMLRYLIEHRYLPDARLNSIYGEERGRQLLQDNFDFLARAKYRADY